MYGLMANGLEEIILEEETRRSKEEICEWICVVGTSNVMIFVLYFITTTEQ